MCFVDVCGARCRFVTGPARGIASPSAILVVRVALAPLEEGFWRLRHPRGPDHGATTCFVETYFGSIKSRDLRLPLWNICPIRPFRGNVTGFSQWKKMLVRPLGVGYLHGVRQRPSMGEVQGGSNRLTYLKRRTRRARRWRCMSSGDSGASGCLILPVFMSSSAAHFPRVNS